VGPQFLYVHVENSAIRDYASCGSWGMRAQIGKYLFTHIFVNKYIHAHTETRTHIHTHAHARARKHKHTYV